MPGCHTRWCGLEYHLFIFKNKTIASEISPHVEYGQSLVSQVGAIKQPTLLDSLSDSQEQTFFSDEVLYFLRDGDLCWILDDYYL